MKKPLQSVFKPIFKAVLGVSKWWASLHPLASFAYDLVNNRYMRSGGASTQALSLTEDRASSALVLQSNGTYVERYGPRTNICTNYNYAGSAAGIGFSGSTPPIMTIVDDALAPEGKAFKVEGQAAAGSGLYGYVLIPGVPTSGLEYTMSAQIRGGVGDLRDSVGSGQSPFSASATYKLRTSTFTTTTANMTLSVFEDEVIYFHSNQFELGPDVTPIIEVQGAAVTTEPELAIGQGVGLQVSQAVTNYISAPDMTGAVAGVPGGYPDGWQGFNSDGGVQREIVGVGERNGMPTLKLRFSGQWDSGHAGFTNISMSSNSVMPLTESDQLAHGLHMALIAGSLAPVSAINLNTYYRLVGAYKGQSSLPLLATLTSEFKSFAAFDTALAPIGGTCDATDTAINFSVPVETPFDFTLEIGGPFLSPIGFIPPLILGSGLTTTRVTDNPVVVQGLGDETVVDAMSPADWDPINASLTPNGDGSANIASIGEFYHRSGSSSEAWQAGVLQRGFFEFEAGTSGAGLIVLRNVDTANVYAQAAGYVGALTVTHDTGCTFVITNQTESNGVHRLEYEFTSDFDVTNTQVAFGPNTDAVGNDVKLKKGGLSVVLPYPGYNTAGILPMGPGIERLPDATNPQAWGPTGGTRVDNPDGTADMVSSGADWHRLQVVPTGWINGVALKGVLKYREGTSGRFRMALRDGDASNESTATGLVGALSVTQNTAGTLVLTSQTFDGVTHTIEYDFTPNSTPTSRSLGVGPDTATAGEAVTVVSGSLKQASVPVGTELVASGGFDVQADVDLWTVQAGSALTLGTLAMRVANVGANYGGSALAVPTTTGRVYALSGERSSRGGGAGVADCHLGGAGSHNRYVNSGEWGNGPFYSLIEEAAVNISATVGGNTDGAWKEHDNISLQEVEPGVVIEAVGVWGSVEFNTALTLTDNDDNHIVVRRNASGKAHLRIILGGVSSNYYSTIDWPDDVEGTFRLELTDTDGGCFVAVFLDDVFVIGSDAFAYPQPINQLVLAPVAGFKTITEIYGK